MYVKIHNYCKYINKNFPFSYNNHQLTEIIPGASSLFSSLLLDLREICSVPFEEATAGCGVSFCDGILCGYTHGKLSDAYTTLSVLVKPAPCRHPFSNTSGSPGFIKPFSLPNSIPY